MIDATHGEFETHPMGTAARVAELEAQVAMLKRTRRRAVFNAGYLIACCNTVHLHSEPEIARDVLEQAQLSQADLDEMPLTDFDRAALAQIIATRRESPIQPNPKGT